MSPRIGAAIVIVVGLAQMAGDLVRLTPLKALAAATGASPAPRVFSAVKGWETYSARFFVEWTDAEGAAQSLQLTPAVNARVSGPYVRRNVFGAALAYGPALATNDRTRPMYEAVTRYALCGEAPLLRELGIERGGGHDLRVRFEPIAGDPPAHLPRVLDAPCP